MDVTEYFIKEPSIQQHSVICWDGVRTNIEGRKVKARGRQAQKNFLCTRSLELRKIWGMSCLLQRLSSRFKNVGK